VAELERSLGELARVFARSPVGFCVFDGNLRFRYVNPTLAVWHGLPAEDHIGRTVGEVLPALAAPLDPLLRQTLDGGEPVVNLALALPASNSLDGSTSFRTTFTPVCNDHGAVIGVSCLVTEATGFGRDEDVDRETQALLLDAVDSMAQGFIIYDAEDRIVVFNQRSRDILPELTDLIVPGTHYSELVEAIFKHRGMALTAAEKSDLIARQTAYHHRLTEPWDIQTDDGRRLRIMGSRTRDGGIAEIITDVTEARSGEIALRHSEQRFQDFAASSSDWLWEMDSDLRFTYMSSNVERVVGVPAAWHYGKTREDLLGDDAESEEWREHLALLRRHEPFRDFIYFRQGEDIEARWLSSSGIPVYDKSGEFTGYRGVGSDVSDRMAAEEELRISEKRFQDYANISADWFAETDAEHRYSFVSDSVSILGLMPSDLIGKERMGFLGEDTAPDLRTDDVAAMFAHRPFRNIERQFGVAGNRWLRISGEPFFDNEGAFLGYRITGTDITELRENEAALRKRKPPLQLDLQFGRKNHRRPGGMALWQDSDRDWPGRYGRPRGPRPSGDVGAP